MKKLIGFLFAVAALAAALVWPISSRGQDPKPIAVCSEGKCVVSEEDWERYKEFHRQTRRMAVAVDEQTKRLVETIQITQAKLTKCEAIVAMREL